MLRSYSNALVSVRRVTQVNAGKNTPGIDKLLVKTVPSGLAPKCAKTTKAGTPWKERNHYIW
jgi:RNA-directed DNA polymerase